MSYCLRSRLRCAAIVTSSLLGTSVARAQFPVPDAPPVAASVVGVVVIHTPEREIGVPGVTVTVHRVGADSAGALDSAVTDAGGRYTVRYRRFGSDDAVYFAAAMHHGIAYFSSPLRGVLTRGGDAEISVFDTTSVPVVFTVQGHHIVVSAPKPDGGRDIVEVYELSNDTTVTVVGRDSLAPVWSTPIPREATAFVAGQGDVSPVTLERRGDRVTLAAAFSPGVKQLSYSYTLGPGAFPLQFAIERATGVLEVLLEEPTAQARATVLRPMPDATTQGRTFKRFLAQGAPAGTTIRVDVPATTAGTRARVLAGVAIVIALAMLGALARALMRRTPRRAPPAPAPHTTESLIAEIAALDARHEQRGTLAPAMEVERYTHERALLKAQLTAALAAERPPS